MSKAVERAFIDEAKVEKMLNERCQQDGVRIREILSKASEMKGLSDREVCLLMSIQGADLEAELFESARRLKEEIYGKRLVLFAPLYTSNHCANECLYCAFRMGNRSVARRTLSQEEIANEVRVLAQEGQKRLLLVAGEIDSEEGFSYILKAIETIYNTKQGAGEIRRLNVNIAPLTLEQFKDLKASNIGTYQIFQETYHHETYLQVHQRGKKRDYNWRISSLDRAMEAGIDDIGIGVLFGLYDWRFEILAMMQHIRHLEGRHGVGPHTISVPRIEPASGSKLSSSPPYAVSDRDFRKVIAILRLAVPYTGIILSTRESPAMRRESFAIGVSQISAGSRTNPGGYSEAEREAQGSQFSLGDHRHTDEVIRDVASLGYIPSFCTSCYRLGRTGEDFMELAKPGQIKYHCEPNALSSFMEYLFDYASPETRSVGEKLVVDVLADMDEEQRRISSTLIEKVRAGYRDVYC